MEVKKIHSSHVSLHVQLRLVNGNMIAFLITIIVMMDIEGCFI